MRAPSFSAGAPDKPWTDLEWLVWSHEHKAWWRPNSMGYTTCRAKAGRYTFEEASEIVKNANYGLDNAPNEAMVPVLNETT